MQELLARLKALDPNASLALRIIACFDELVRGGVNIHGLLGAAASLSGCVAGYAGHESARTLRVSPGGEVLKDGGAERRVGALEADGMTVWLERDGPARVNDRMILERLALALAIRSGHTAEDPLRRLGDLLDEQRRQRKGIRSDGFAGTAVGIQDRDPDERRRHRRAIHDE